MATYQIEFTDGYECGVQALTESDAIDMAVQLHEANRSFHPVRGCGNHCYCSRSKNNWNTPTTVEEVG